MDLGDEVFNLREDGILITNKEQMIVPRQFNKLRVGNVRRYVSPFFDVGIAISSAMKNKSRNAYRRQNVAHINRSIQARQSQRRARTGAAPLITRPPASKTFVMSHARRQIFNAQWAAPLVLDRVVKLLSLF